MVNLTASVEHTGQFFNVDVPEYLTFDDFRAYLSAESGVEPADQLLILDGGEFKGDGTHTLQEMGLKDNEIIVIRDKKKIQQPLQQTARNTGAAGATADDSGYFERQIEMLRQQLLASPQMRQQMLGMNPILEQYLDDPVQFREIVTSSLQQSGTSVGGSDLPGGVSREEWMRLQQDPDNPENQKRIMELIEQDQIEENMRAALEMTPESFATVTMLYINVEVNGFPVKAFVDSGAQTTIMSTELAKKCNLTRLIDKRFKGEARGVGKTEIVGRIHSTQLKIEDRFIPCSFTVLDTHVDMLLGLDMLRRHQACIDLKNNKLVIEGIETPFLPESEVPKNTFSTGLGQQDHSLDTSAPSAAAASSQSPTSPAAAAAAAAVSRNQEAQTVRVDETTITNLMSLGFSRHEVMKALEQAGGNVEVAAALLFQ
jgi:DNA damage-inducible protein 1